MNSPFLLIKEDIPVLSEIGCLIKYSKNLNITTQYDFSDYSFNRFRIGSEYFLTGRDNPLTLRFGLKESNDSKTSFLYYIGFGMSFKMNNEKNNIFRLCT